MRAPWARARIVAVGVAVLVASTASAAGAGPVEQLSPALRVKEYPVPAFSHPHDVAPARDGSVWYTAQAAGKLGRLDPATGDVTEVDLGEGSAPHGVIVGPDGAAWVTDGGRNAIVRVDNDHKVTVLKLPIKDYTNLNTGVFDKTGIYWFTGQSGYHGRLDPKSGDIA